MIPSYKNEIIFDLLNSNYIRTVVVKEKSGLRNLREKEENESNDITITNNEKIRRKKKKRDNIDINEISSDEERKVKIMLTKEKILELQARDSNGIKSFINLLPFYGNEISLIKHTPNKEKYPAGKAQEPLIKIDVSHYMKRIEARIRENPAFFRNIKNKEKEEKLNLTRENNSLKTSFISSVVNQTDNTNNNKGIEEINRGFVVVDNSFSLINIFNIRSITIVKFVDFFIYAFTISITIIEFVLAYIFLKDNKNRFYYLSNSYKLLNDVSYVKYYITEGIIINYISDYTISRFEGKDEIISYIKSELAIYREDISNCLNTYTAANIKFSDEYKDYTSNTKITIRTLSNGVQKDEEQPFFSAMNKLTTSIFYISTSSGSEIINLNNTYSYELMVNLLNGYYISFEKLILILLNDFKIKAQNSGIKNIVIFSISLFFACIYLIIFWKMMSSLDNDREKPINLFLTIKKKIFEDLKNSAENFSNKLLNKFFGVDENEEESQQYYQANVKPNDINIAKFKALNEFKASNNKKSTFLYYFFQLAFFYFLYNIFTLIKYINIRFYYSNIEKFSQVYNSTQFSQIYLITTVDIVKQYYFNKSITIYNLTEDMMINSFLLSLLKITDQLEDTLKQMSKTNCFLKDEYKQFFRQYMYNDFSEIIKNEEYFDVYSKKAEIGFKSISFEIFEIIRFLNIKYFIDNERNKTLPDNISDLVMHPLWGDAGDLMLYVVRPWYNKIIEEMETYFYEFIDDKIVSYIFVFITIIIIVSVYYWIIWKRFEDDFINSIRRSFNLINLIPEEIKNIIVNKLNEQN